MAAQLHSIPSAFCGTYSNNMNLPTLGMGFLPSETRLFIYWLVFSYSSLVDRNVKQVSHPTISALNFETVQHFLKNSRLKILLRFYTVVSFVWLGLSYLC